MNLSESTLLRDLLAIDRTILANERTLLAYGRTLLALFAAGATVIHFGTEWWATPLGVGLIAVGLLLFGFGVYRYRLVNRHLGRARTNLSPAESHSK
jgi:putative membrane protein